MFLIIDWIGYVHNWIYPAITSSTAWKCAYFVGIAITTDYYWSSVVIKFEENPEVNLVNQARNVIAGAFVAVMRLTSVDLVQIAAGLSIVVVLLIVTTRSFAFECYHMALHCFVHY